MSEGIIVGIDVTRNRSGGAIAHIKGLLEGSDPCQFGVGKVHLWGYADILEKCPDWPWLHKHMVVATEKSLLHQLAWQYFSLPKELKTAGCDILFNTDAGSICPVVNSVTLSQDMLSFEQGEKHRYGFSLSRLRLEVLWHIQARSLSRSLAAIFLTQYARRIISGQIPSLKYSEVIAHGVDDIFRGVRLRTKPKTEGPPTKCLYISNAAPYKHHWNVVEAVASLREKGYDLTLQLVGGGHGPARRKLEESIKMVDSEGAFITQFEQVKHDSISDFHAQADIFIFASSCENQPITLLEAMAAGLPICCSDRGPMPEVLCDAGLYFDPECPHSIMNSLEKMCQKADRVSHFGRRAELLSRNFSWQRCSEKTWSLLVETAKKTGC